MFRQLDLEQKPQYVRLTQEVLAKGHKVQSRYGPCIELIGGRMNCIPGDLVTRKNINYALGWMELLQLVGQVFDPDALKRVAPSADHSLFTHSMAYGPRIKGQIPELIQALSEDNDTRQAVLFIGKPENGCTSNLPCTLTMQFLIRDGAVHAVVSMRSWDLCRGLPYDLMMFTGLLEIIATCLGKVSGTLTVNAGSAHIYEDQMDKIPFWAPIKWKFVNPSTEWEDFVDWARREIPLLERGETPKGIKYFEV